MEAQTGRGSRERVSSGSQRRCLFFILVFMVVFLMRRLCHHKNQTTSFLDNLKEPGEKTASTGKDFSNSANINTTTRINSTNRNTTTTRINSTSRPSPAQKDLTPSTTTPPYVSPGPYYVEYPYKYHFTINQPRTCEDKNPFLVLVVPVAPENRARRDIIRSTWGGESPVLNKVVTLFFLLGLHNGEESEQLQEQLQQESQEHGDLIQSNFVDCYKNLTIKTMVMLEWLDAYCPNAAYAMKIDTDVFLNVPNLIAMLENAPKTNYMTGYVDRLHPVRRIKHLKWYVPIEVYPRLIYPPFALGSFYILSLDLPKKLLEAAKHVKALYIEDVYLALCMEHLGIGPTNPPHWYYFHAIPLLYSRCVFSQIIATTIFESADRVWMWNDLKKANSTC